MKSSNIAVMLLAMSTLVMQGQTNPAPQYSVSERGPNHRVWQGRANEPGPDGMLHPRVHSYTELATGMHYKDASGQWVESKEEFELLPGKAVAKQGQHKVALNYNLNSAGAIEMETPDGKTLKSHVLGLSYFDASSGDSVLIAEIKDCAGKVSGNQVLYEDAFTDIRADVRYTYSKSGFEQDIILREQPPRPEVYGFNPATTRLQVLTEFLNPIQPVKENGGVITSGSVSFPDETLSFGVMKMGRGKAFSLSGAMKDVSVGKQWLKLEGRDFLVEEVAVPELEDSLKTLPMKRSLSLNPVSGAVKHTVSNRRLFPVPRLAKVGTNQVQMAALTSTTPGVVLDYTTINTSQTNYVFKGDSTYLLSGNVSLYGTNSLFEAGAVLKYASNVTLTVNTPVTWTADAYRPVVLTSQDDNTVGESVGNGNPGNNYYANPALYFNAGSAGTNLVLCNVRVSNAKTALAINGGSGHTLNNVQLVICGNGLALTNTDACLRNALFDRVMTNFTGSSSTGRVEHLTSDIANWLNQDMGQYLYLTNCLLVGVTNLGNYQTPLQNVNQASGGSGVFQAVGGGSHYLAVSSTNRDAGTTGINADLANNLRKLTTYAPSPLTNLTFASATNFSARNIRDTDTPDLGYHYASLDYLVSNVTLSASLTLTNGVALGMMGAVGIDVQVGGNVYSEGTPLNLNRLTHWANVQEQRGSFGGDTFLGMTNASAYPSIRCRFTDLSQMSGTFGNAVSYGGGGPLKEIVFRDSQLRGCSFYRYYYSAPQPETWAWTNNVLERSSLILCHYEPYTGTTDTRLYLYNNLLKGGSLDLEYYDTGVNSQWDAHDNLLDGTTQTINLDQYGHDYFLQDHNGFTLGTVHGLVGGFDKINLLPDYQTGSLGNYYYHSSGTNLCALVNAGSRTAAAAGLYHFTTQTNQTKETNSVVDIGYHYVAITNGAPIDTDGDGSPDYVEDANGNGSVNPGETDPADYYNGVLPSLTKTGDGQSGPLNAFLSQPLTVRAATSGGAALANAPVTFSIMTGLNQLAATTNGPLSSSLSLRTDVNGYAAAWLFFPSNAPVNNTVTVTAQSGSNVAQISFSVTVSSVSVPTITPAGGAFATMQDVTVNCGTVGAIIHYTLNGNVPTEADPTNLSGGTVLVQGTSTLKVKAFKPNELIPSAVQSADFRITGAIAAGDNHTLAVKYDRTAWAAGLNDKGQLGINSTTVYKSNLVSVLNLTNAVVAVSGGASHSLALLTNGTVRAWGLNTSGQLGDNTTTLRSTNIVVTNLTGVIAISAGSLHSLALLTNGAVRAWGENGNGQLGNNGAPTDQKTNVVVVGLSNVVSIAAGGSHSLALLTNGTVRAWGLNTSGQLGDNTTSQRNTNVVVTNLTGVIAIAAGGSHSLALLTNGFVRAWGENSSGQLGNNGSPTDQKTNVLVVGLSNVVAIAAGGSHSLALLADTTVRAWGLNDKGQLGDGTTASQRNTNVVVVGLSNVVAIAAGSQHSLALKNDGTVVVWGYTNYGLNNVSGNYSRTPVTREPSVHLTYWTGPSIVTQPQSQTATVGQNVVLSVTTIGTMPMSYQWYSNSVALSGATSAVLSFSNVQTNASASYYVVADNGIGTVTSSTATLAVWQPPSILVQPTDQQAVAGNTVTFEVSAAGSLPLNYQWCGVNHGTLANKTAPLLRFDSVQPADNDNYYVIATNGGGSITSSVAALKLSPSVIVQPVDGVLMKGSQASFTVTAAGASPLSYQWYGMNTGMMSGQTSSTLSLNNLQVGNTDRYYVVIANTCGAVSSYAAKLTVIDPAVDAGGNGLPDAWETNYFGSSGVDPNADPDQDGWTNLQEYQNGTNPNAFDQPFKAILTRPDGKLPIP